MQGMIVSILENKRLGNCSNNGISSKFNSALLVGDNVPKIFDAGNLPVVKLVNRMGYLSAEPIEPCPKGHIGYMMGGSFIHSSDSRFSALNQYPIPLHDRTETQREYDILSR